ncbi:ABC transporter permease subunit [Streptomyces sichuanensis]|uniref:ABC transporter permease subunit n=1 Tax=Streptomyces sichuanensis TaxID=2871810 RepID=UPI0035583A2B
MSAPSASGPPAARRRPYRVPAGLLPALGPVPVLLLAAAGPLLAPHPVDKPVTAPYGPPGGGALLGGDQLGRDVWSRLLHGGGPLVAGSLAVAVTVTALGAVLGCFAALDPRLGRLVERGADLVMLVPPVLGFMLFALAWPGGRRLAVVAAAVVLGTPYAVRVVAAAAAPPAAAGFTEAARAGGEHLWYLALREVLPTLRSTVLALFGLRFVAAVYVLSMAGFLQLGPQPPTPDWALMIRENAPGILLNPWAVVAPALAIAVLAVGTHLAADRLPPTGRRTEALR